MKICPNCGARNAADAQFCTTCGYSLTGVAPVAAGPAPQPQGNGGRPSYQGPAWQQQPPAGTDPRGPQRRPAPTNPQGYDQGPQRPPQPNWQAPGYGPAPQRQSEQPAPGQPTGYGQGPSTPQPDPYRQSQPNQGPAPQYTQRDGAAPTGPAYGPAQGPAPYGGAPGQPPYPNQNANGPYQQAPMPPRTENPRVTHAKREASNYFANVLHSWLHPMDWAAGQDSERPYYGIVSLAVLALLNTLVFWTVLQHAAQLFISILGKVVTGSPMESIFKDFLNTSPSTIATVQTQFNTAIKAVSGNIYLTVFLLNIVALALFAGVGYAAKRFLMGDDQDFFRYVNQLGYYANGGLVIALVMVLLGMMGSLAGITFLVLMLLISTGLFNGAFFMATTQGSQKRFDKLYTVVIAQFVMNIIVFGLVGSQLAKILNVLLNIK